MTVNAKNGILNYENSWNDHELIAPIKVLILNLMPTKRATERQFLQLLNSLNQDIEVTFLYPKTHHFKTTDQKLIADCYCSLQQISHNYYDGLIITGAPVEQIDFETVDYWQEFQQIKRWSEQHVGQTINECWASQAALYHDFAIPKVNLSHKLFGIYQATDIKSVSGLDYELDHFTNPQSRHSESVINPSKLPYSLEIVASNPIAGPMILHSSLKRQTYITGHPEYDTNTLDGEYQRDIAKQTAIQEPNNYYDSKHQVTNTWRPSSIQLYQNWINLIESDEFITDIKIAL